MLKHKIVLPLCATFLLSGCAEHSMRVSPENLSSISYSAPMECQIVYEESNQEYLPTLLKNNPNSSLATNYSYTVHYVNGNTDWDGLNLFNPLIFVGFPMSGESVIVEGKLQIKEKEVVVKELRASCVSNKTRNLFQTGGSSGPRKDCLIAVRDNIDTQIKHFKKELSHE